MREYNYAPESGLNEFLDRMEREGVGKLNQARGMISYLDYKARERGVPLRGTFELTPQCNLDCKMCYVHLSDEQLQSNPRRMLTGEEWKKIMQAAVDRGMMYALLTGGEAMLHPDFDMLYLYLREQGVKVSVNTNGLLLTDERIAFFKEHQPAALRITLYGSDDNAYEQVTGRRVFDRVISGIRRAKEAGIYVTAGVTPSKYNEDDLIQTVNLLRSMGVEYNINSGLSEPRDGTGREETEHDMETDAYVRLYASLRKTEGTSLMPSCEEDIPVPGGFEMQEKRGLRCGGGRSSFSVIWSGFIQPCLTFSEVHEDLLQTTFDEAWQRIFAVVSDYPIPVECFGCPYQILCTPCVVRHAAGAPLGHANPEICRRAMAMARAGLMRKTEK